MRSQLRGPTKVKSGFKRLPAPLVQQLPLAHPTAQNFPGFAPMCTSVHLRAPSCGKMKKSKMVHKPHITAHPDHLHLLDL